MPARTKRITEKVEKVDKGSVDINFFHVGKPNMNKQEEDLLTAALSSHYREGFADKIEVLDILKDKLTPEQFEGFCLGSMFKYILRANFKEDANKDLAKAVDYGTILQEFRRERNVNR